MVLEAIVALVETKHNRGGFGLFFEYTGEFPLGCRKSELIGNFDYLGPDREGNRAIYYGGSEVDGPISYLSQTLLKVTKDKDRLQEIIYEEAKKFGEEKAKERDFPGHVNVTFQDQTKYAKQTTSNKSNKD